MIFKGVFSVLPTPFTAAGEIDTESLKRVADLGMNAGVTGFTALGVTSEVDKLTESERGLILDAVLARTSGRVPVVAGATANGLPACIAYARMARQAGAAAIMVSPPRLVKLNSDTISRHFQELAGAVDLPIVIQDYPPVSGYTMEPSLLVRLAREVPAAKAIKLEDAPTPLKTAQLRKLLDGDPVAIFGGLGGTFLLEELMAGADGAMTGFAVPEVLVEIVGRFQRGDHSGAAAVFYRNVPLMRFEFQAIIGTAIRKELYRRRGAIANPLVRQPGAQLDAGTSLALDRLLVWMKENQEVTWI